MKIIKQCRDFFPAPSSGHLLGLDVKGVLQITNSYPLPSSQDDLPPGANLETERRRQQALWVKTLSEVNVDNNMVGWYQSAYLGSFMNGRVVDGLVAAGQNQMLNDKAVLIIHGNPLLRDERLMLDVSRSASGPISLRAFRLTAAFLAAHKEGKFTVERYLNTLIKGCLLRGEAVLKHIDVVLVFHDIILLIEIFSKNSLLKFIIHISSLPSFTQSNHHPPPRFSLPTTTHWTLASIHTWKRTLNT
jgi:hypothetical protein